MWLYTVPCLVLLCQPPPSQEQARQVSTEEAAAYAAQMGCLFVETSAKTAAGVSKAFTDALERIVETPELWAVQEHRRASLPKSPTSPEAPELEACTQAENDRNSENSGRRVIGGFVVTPNAIRFGGHCRNGS
jgi:hypothetical protein